MTELAKAAGLEIESSYPGSDEALSGSFEGYPVRIVRKSPLRGRDSTAILGFSVEMPALTHSGLTIRATGVLGSFARAPGKAAFAMNDPEFDEKLVVHGRTPEGVRALLHPEARTILFRLVRACSAGNIVLENGRLDAYFEMNDPSGTDEAFGTLRTLARLASILSRPKRIKDLLLENYAAETLPGVRALYLESLVDLGTTFTIDDALIQDALASPCPDLYLRAVRAVGPPAHRSLPSILPKASDAEAEAILDWYRTNCPTGLRSLLPSLFPKYNAGPPVRTALIRLHGACGDPASVPWLRAQYDESSGGDRRRACLEALGACGTYETIGFLHDKRNPLNAGEVDAAIARIQARIGAGGAGRLSAAKDDELEGRISGE